MPARMAGEAIGSSMSRRRAPEGSPSACAEARMESGIDDNPEAVFRTIGSRL